MLTGATSPAEPDERRAIAVAAVLVAVIVTVDVLSGHGVVFIGLLISAPLLCSLTTTPRTTAAAGLTVVAIAAASASWNDTWGSWTYWVPLTVVTLASSFAVVMAITRRRVLQDAGRLERLSRDLSSAERQLAAILANIDAAVIVRHADGSMVYANDAAAHLLGLPDAAAVAAEPSSSLMARFDVYSEEGDPIALDDLPGTRLLAGDPVPRAVLVRNVVKATGEERWLLNRATGVRDADGRAVMAVNLVEDITDTKRAEIGQRLLAETARAAAEADDLDHILQAIADAAVPGLADWAGVDLLDARGRIVTVAVAHRDPEKVRLGWRLRTAWPVDPGAPDGLPAVIRSGVPQLLREIPDELLVAGAQDDEHLEVLRAVGLTSTMIVPIQAGARILGALSFVSSTSRRFDDRDLELAGDLGRQAGVLINNAQLNTEQAHIARTLQAGLLPDALPALDGWQVEAVYRAAGRANEVGGDFYDLVQFDGGWSAIIGDVVGKGAEAAVLTALARHTLAAIIESTGDPAHALGVLNRRLRERGTNYPGLCTIAVLTVTGDRASIISAGHPLPLLARGAVIGPVGTASRMLGVVDDLRITAADVALAPGDELLLFTDGVLDAVGAADRFGHDRLVGAMRDRPGGGPGGLATHVLDELDAFAQGEQSDDIAMIAITRAPAGLRTAA